jgi:polar amino acid transport system substrate-binding protein
VDLLCGADTVTLGRRETVSFTVPVFLTGISAVLSANAPRYLNEVIAGQAAQAPSRAAVLQAIRHKTFGARSGTTAETWLSAYVARFGGTAEVVAVDDHADGIAGVASGALDAYFADRALLLGQLQTVENPDQFVVSDRLFSFEPYAIALPRGDEDLRLVADRTLSHFFASPDYAPFFQGYFGTPDELQKLALTIGTIPD